MNTDRLYFTADTHFGHKATLRFAERLFVDVDEMDEALIERWNAVVPPDGHVYHLGDVSFRCTSETLRILPRLNGTKYLVLGNHDNGLSAACLNEFHWVKPYHELSVNVGEKLKIVLCHYAMRVWNRSHYGAWQLYGHSHGSLPAIGRQMDVGADTHELRPYTFNEVAEVLERRSIHVVDHHVIR